MRRGYADLPLHTGKAPAWLFSRMCRLASDILEIMVIELGTNAVLERIADPFWFQCLGCVLGFDWHSSGLTTTTCGAIKIALLERGKSLGIYAAGGKGNASRNTPQELVMFSEKIGIDGSKFVYASRMSAKVDSVAVQDGFQIYHHSFFFTKSGAWCVVQQGMNETTRWARRYHWLCLDGKIDFVCEPHLAICSKKVPCVLNMVAQESADCRKTVTGIVCSGYKNVISDISKLHEIVLKMPYRHKISIEDFDISKLSSILKVVEKEGVDSFEKLLGIKGVGAKTIRALALVSEIIYGKPPSFRDPARYSYAHGGKDGTPYYVHRPTYDTTCRVLEKAIKEARIGIYDKVRALQRFKLFMNL